MKKLEEMTVEELKVYVYDASKLMQKLQNEINACENKIVELMRPKPTPIKEVKE